MSGLDECGLDELRDRLAALEARLDSVDTQVDATEQSLEALAAAHKNRDKLRELDERVEVAIRSFNAIACVLCGAVLLWFGNDLSSDQSVANDKISDWLIMGGGGCIAYGLLVLTSNESRVLGWIETVNPFRK